VNNEWRTRISEPTWHTDSAIEWGKDGSDHTVRITMIEHSKDQPYSVLGVTTIIASESAADWLQSHIDEGNDADAMVQMIYALADAVEDDDDFNVLLKDQHEVFRRTWFTLEGHMFSVVSSVRWLGMDTGRDLVFRMGGQIKGVAEHVRETRSRPTVGTSVPKKETKANRTSATRPKSTAAKKPTRKPGRKKK
jgi:hypothetical protein